MDIKDFQPAGVDALNGSESRWVATGKHLCGAATDFTLRCCASSIYRRVKAPVKPSERQHAQASAHSRLPSEAQLRGADQLLKTHSNTQESSIQAAQPAEEDLIVDHASDCATINASSQCNEGGSIDNSIENSIDNSIDGTSAAHHAGTAKKCLSADVQNEVKAGLQGLAIATCCHHRCSWQHYVGKPLFKKLGFSPDEFEVISWMTGGFQQDCTHLHHIVYMPTACASTLSKTVHPIAYCISMPLRMEKKLN